MRTVLIIFFFSFSIICNGNAKKEDFVKAYEASNYAETIALAKNALLSNSRNFNAWYYKGLAEKSLYKFNDASASFEKALELSSENTSLLFLLASAYESSGNSVKAIDNYTKIIDIDTAHVAALAHLAKVYKGQKEYVKAIDLYSSLVKIDTTNGYFYSQLAYCCKKFGLKEPVIYYYEKAIALNPQDLVSCKHLVSEFINQKYYADATFLVDTFLTHFPNNMHLLKQKAYIAAIGGNYLDAVQGFQKVVELGDSSLFTCKYYGQSLYNNGEYGKAVYWLKRYVIANEDDTKNQFILGLAYQKDYQYQKSLRHLHIALGQVYDKERIARVYTETGNTYAKYGDYLGFRDSTKTKAPEMYRLANENYLKAFELVPADFEMYRIFGRFYEDKMNDQRMALYYYEKYYNEHDSHEIHEQDFIWVQNKITQMKEELHFMGD